VQLRVRRESAREAGQLQAGGPGVLQALLDDLPAGVHHQWQVPCRAAQLMPAGDLQLRPAGLRRPAR